MVLFIARLVKPSWILLVALAVATGFTGIAGAELEIVGVTVTPHMKLDNMQYRREAEPPDGARVELLIKNTSESPHQLDANARLLFNGAGPADLLESGDWAWHDTPPAHGAAERTGN